MLLCELASVLPPAYSLHIVKLQLKPSQAPEHLLRCLSPGINLLLVPCSSPATRQGDTSKPQLLSETQNSHVLTKKKGKDNGTTSTTAAAHCHIPEEQPQSPIPELPSWDQLRPCMGSCEWIANEESEAQKQEVDCLRTWLLEQ